MLRWRIVHEREVANVSMFPIRSGFWGKNAFLLICELRNRRGPAFDSVNLNNGLECPAYIFSHSCFTLWHASKHPCINSSWLRRFDSTVSVCVYTLISDFGQLGMDRPELVSALSQIYMYKSSLSPSMLHRNCSMLMITVWPYEICASYWIDQFVLSSMECAMSFE